MRSKRLVYSINAVSPRFATASMIAMTVASTSAALSRLPASSATRAASNPASRVLRVIGIGPRPSTRRCGGARGAAAGGLDGCAEPGDPAADLFGRCFEARAVNDQRGSDVRDVLDLDQPIRGEGCAGLHQIDDVAGQAELW